MKPSNTRTIIQAAIVIIVSGFGLASLSRTLHAEQPEPYYVTLVAKPHTYASTKQTNNIEDEQSAYRLVGNPVK